jgi:hypothetical protein
MFYPLLKLKLSSIQFVIKGLYMICDTEDYYFPLENSY